MIYKPSRNESLQSSNYLTCKNKGHASDFTAYTEVFSINVRKIKLAVVGEKDAKGTR